MRLKPGQPLLTAAVVAFAIVALPVSAGIRPSFDLDGCSWNATHVALVRTTSKDGFFSVQES